MSRRPARLRLRAVAALVTATTAGLTLSACQSGTTSSAQNGGSGGADASASSETSPSESTAPAPTVTTTPGKKATGVAVDTLVGVKAAGGTLSKVKVTSDAGDVAGSMKGDEASWKASDRLEPGATYDVLAVAKGDDGQTTRQRSSFTTEDLTLDQQTYPSVAPLQGQTVGVGMPVIVRFDVPVTDRKSIQREMSVESTPKQPGTWHWLNDNEVHWRPKTYWKAGTDVSVKVDVNGVDAGNGIYGQEDRDVDFTVGDAHVYKVDAASHQMRVFSNGDLVRTLPITTGKPGFTTRSGTKVIIEKFESKRMNSETIGINPDSAEGYDLDDVRYAMRVTYSGEFIHAAPWSVGSQGSANVSHGCTGLSTENAAWLYDMTQVGDVVEYTGTDRAMTLDNGYGDWNESFAQYKQGSALG